MPRPSVPLELVRAYEAGGSTEDVARELRVSTWTALRRLHEVGAKVRKRGRIPTSAATLERTREVYRQHRTVRAAARVLCLSENTVRRRLEVLGVPVTRPPWRTPELDARDAAIRAARAQGDKLAAIAALHGISVERVSQLCRSPAPAP